MRRVEDGRRATHPVAGRGGDEEIDLTADGDRGGGPIPQELRAAIADRLEARLDDLESTLFAAMIAGIPSYRRLTTDPLGSRELRGSLRGVVAMFVELVRHPEMATTRALAGVREFGREIGRQRSSQGIPLEDVQNGAHLALKTGLRQLRADIRELGVTPSTFEAAGQLGEALHDYVNVFSGGVALGFMQAQERRAGAHAEERAELVAQILDGAVEKPEQLGRVAAALGVECLSPCTLLVVAPSEQDDQGAPRLAGPVSTLLDGIETALRGPVRFTPAAHAAVVIPHDGTARWTDVVRHIRDVASFSNLLVVNQGLDDASQLPPTYAWICQLLDVPGAERSPGIVEIRDLVPDWLVGGSRVGAEFTFVRWALGSVLGLPSKKSEQLLAAARACIDANAVNKRAAEILGVDPRTVSQHRDEFEALTHLTLNDVDDRRIVDHALLVVERRPAALPAPGTAEWAEPTPPRLGR